MVSTPSNFVVQNLLSVDFHTKNFKVRLTWDVSTDSDIASYRLYRNWVPYGTFRLINTITHPTVEYTDAPPLDIVPLTFATGIDGEWWYRISAISTSGVESALTDPVTYEKTDAFSTSPFGAEVIDGITIATYTDTGSSTTQTDFPDNSELEYYFQEIRRRKLWLVQNDGEDILLVKRRMEGDKCPFWNDRSSSCSQPLGDPIGTDACYGTGIIGGYYTPVKIKARIVPSGQGVRLIQQGRQIQYEPRSWTIWTPRVANWDFLVRRDSRRLEITNVQRQNFRGLITHQLFDVVERPPIYTDNIYSVPISETLARSL